MKVISREDVQLSSLRLPGEVASLARDSSLDGLAMSIQETFLLHPLIIRKRDGRFIAGRKRSAAALRAGLHEVPVVWVDCSDQEAAILTEIENAYRLHDRKAQKEAMLRLIDLRTVEIATKGAPPKQLGRRRSARAVAITEVAEATGYSETYLRTEDYRLRRREERVEKRKRKPEFELKGLGVIPDNELVEKTRLIAQQAEKVKRAYRRYDKEMCALLKSTYKAYADCKFTEAELRTPYPLDLIELRTPYSVCPACKNFSKLQQSCNECFGRGWVSKTVFDRTDKKLLDEEKICVLVDGNIVPVEEAGVTEDEGWL